MLDAIGTMLVGTAMAVILAGVVTTIPVALTGRLALAGIIGAWVGLAGAVAAAGALSNPTTVLAMFGTPLVMTFAVVLGWPTARRAVAAIPLPLLIGLNTIRLAGVLFVLLAVDGRLSGPFPYSAGWGDLATGAFSIPVAWLAAREAGSRDRLILAWNTFGLLDLGVAVALGLISRNGSPLQLIHAGVGSEAMQFLPWAFVPTALVPIFIIAHGIVFARLRSRMMDNLEERPLSAGDFSHAG